MLAIHFPVARENEEPCMQWNLFCLNAFQSAGVQSVVVRCGTKKI